MIDSTYLSVFINAKSLTEKNLDTISEGSNIVKMKIGTKSGSFKHEQAHIFGDCIVLIINNTAHKLLNKRMSRIDFEILLLLEIIISHCVLRLGMGIRTGQAFHISGPTELRGDQSTW